MWDPKYPLASFQWAHRVSIQVREMPSHISELFMMLFLSCILQYRAERRAARTVDPCKQMNSNR
jgi:hypothetical protein